MVVTEPTEETGTSQQYQTVTLLPSEGANGDVSYVLVVQQEDAKPDIKVDQVRG